MYVDQGNKKAIMNFFESSSNRRNIIVEAEEMEEFLKRKDDPEMHVLILALIHEHVHEKYNEALKMW